MQLEELKKLVAKGESDKGEIIGQQVTTKTLEDIAFELKRIEPPAFPEIETVAIGNQKSIIVVRVPGKMGTYCYDGRPYIRHGSTIQIMPRSEYEKRVLDKFHAHRRWENEIAPDWITVQDLDEDEIQSTPKCNQTGSNEKTFANRFRVDFKSFRPL